MRLQVQRKATDITAVLPLEPVQQQIAWIGRCRAGGKVVGLWRQKFCSIN